MKLGYLGIDQYGKRYKMDKYPRKELLEQTGYSNASKMYMERKDGSSYHDGYVIGPHWITVHEVHSWDRN